jgi:hypothetical protein
MPLPDFSAEMSQIENENKGSAPLKPPTEEINNTDEGDSGDTPPLTEEEIFKKQKREKLLNHLAECRKLSAAKRKAQKEEKQKNKKPRGRPKKNPQEENVIISEASPVEELPPATPVRRAPPTPEPVKRELPTIDYDRIIDGVHQKYLKSKAERKAKKAPAPAPAPTMVYQPPAPAQPAFDKSAFEAQIREDERNRIRGEVQRKKQEQEALKQRTKDYYSRLPPRSLAAGKNWDEYFFA